MRFRVLITGSVFLLCAVPAHAQHEHHAAAEAPGEALGTVEFHVILSGRIAQAEGDAEAAVARMREADLERMVEKHIVTPGALLPAYEGLGDLPEPLQLAAGSGARRPGSQRDREGA